MHKDKMIERVKYNVGKKPVIIGGILLITILFLVGLLIIGYIFSKELTPKPVLLNNTKNITNNTTNISQISENETVHVLNETNITVNETNATVVNPCENLTGEEYNECMMLNKKNVSYCNSFDCILKYVDVFNDTNGCNALPLIAESLACNAIINNQADICSKAEFQRTADQCYWLYVNHTGDVYYCNEIKVSDSYKTKCYSFAAVLKKDYRYCNNLVSGDKDECYIKYSTATGDISVCDKIFLKNVNTYSCYYEPALKFGRMSYCKYIDAQQRDWCYNNVLHLSEKLDTTDCDDVPAYSWREECFMKLAEQENDKSYCDKLSSENNIQECYNKFQ